MIERRWRAVEADIQHYYGLDARFVGARRLLTLIQGLPAGSQALGHGGWFVEHELLATLLEVTVRANSKQKKGQPSFRVPRPPTDTGLKRSARSRMQELKRQLKGG